MYTGVLASFISQIQVKLYIGKNGDWVKGTCY